MRGRQVVGPVILDVVYISDARAAIKAGCSDGIRWRITSREEGERVAAELAAELRDPVEDGR
jgi:hypothetical protein